VGAPAGGIGAGGGGGCTMLVAAVSGVDRLAATVLSDTKVYGAAQVCQN